MSKVERIIQESKQTFRKEEGMFKTTYHIGGIKVVETTQYIEIHDAHEHYGSPITDKALEYLRCVLDKHNGD